MATTPVPSPSLSPGHPADLTKTLIHSLAHGVWAMMTGSPLVGVIIGIGLVVAVTGFVRSVIHSGHARDPIRRFRGADRAIILAHAGHRCEHHAPLLGRCRQTERLEADHIHPWSRGGQTAVANGQALCRRHNREKRAAVPFGRQLRSLEKRRAEYYPPGVSGAVTRHAPPPPRLPKRPARRTPTA